MSAILEVEAYQTEVTRIVQDVLLTIASYECEPADLAYQPGTGGVTCSVFFAGAWDGAVILECPLEMACEFTRRFMRIPPPSRFDDDVCDAMGELANMIGGNLKSVLPPGVALSIPSVVEGSSYSLRICGTNRNHRLAFQGLDGGFWVTLVEIDR